MGWKKKFDNWPNYLVSTCGKKLYAKHIDRHDRLLSAVANETDPERKKIAQDALEHCERSFGI